MKSLIMMVGPTGCGKTMFRKKYFDDVPCISPDDFILGKWTPIKARYAWSYASQVGHILLAEGSPIVLDAQFINPSTRNEWVKMSRAYGYKTFAICFNTPWRQLLKNHRNRGDRGLYGKVPFDVIRASHAKFKRSMAGPSNWFLFDNRFVVDWGTDEINAEAIYEAILG
jgi:predicted kinase